MTTDIFIVTYAKDARWVPFCLRSIQKFGKGFRNTIVIYPREDAHIFRPMLEKFPFAKGFEETIPAHTGHLLQNAFKTSCDLYSDADYYFHMDSDCIMVSEVTPEQQFTDGKVDLLVLPFAELPGVPWKEVTEFALGVPVEMETMRRFPLFFPRWLYKATRERIEDVHKVRFLDYVLKSKSIGRAFYGYSEFNALGNMALSFFRDKFHVQRFEEGIKPWTIKQFWSHSGCTPAEQAQIEAILA